MQFDSLANEIASIQKNLIVHWKQSGLEMTQRDFLRLVEENHAFNYQLWHAEDRARRDDKGFEFVYKAKREIDHCNQQRNNRMELIDEWLVEHLKPAPFTDCPVHSETPGMMIDRLSILALKAYHMTLQTLREEAGDNHRQACLNKLQVLAEQQQQLQSCLQSLVNDVQAKTRTFRVYHQFKMYNDPKLNPELYAPSA